MAAGVPSAVTVSESVAVPADGRVTPLAAVIVSAPGEPTGVPVPSKL